MDSLTLRRPDDFHLHLRDDAVMAAVLPDSVRCFARAIIMPNLKPPVAAVALAAAYRQRILAAIPAGMQFTPLMTLYLTDRLAVDEIDRAVDSGFVHAVKLYPAGATTNADSGVTDLRNVRAVLDRMQLRQLPLLIHCEVADPAVDVFDREAVFIERVLTPLLADFPQLRVVFEHLTTRDGVDFVRAGGDNLAGTITAHHLLLNRNAIFSGGIRPHHYCLPVLKRETHRQALLAAAVSGSSKFFLGSDSAPHPRKAKEAACGCAGCYTAHAAIELYAEAFDSVGALDRLEYFASGAGADFYRLPRNSGAITLERSQWRPPALLPLPPDDELVPFRGGETIAWRLAPATPT